MTALDPDSLIAPLLELPKMEGVVPGEGGDRGVRVSIPANGIIFICDKLILCFK